MDKYLMGSGMKQWKEGKAYEVTFIVTEDCNLRCSYCYQVHKNNKHKMSFDTAKQAVDYLLDNPEMFDAEAVMWDFIGGEPLLEIELIDQIVDYIKFKTYEMDHKWAKNYRINLGTNGTLYDQKNVQNFIKKNQGKLQIGITIDGTKRKHDMHRLYQDGRGSYDDVFKNIPLWLKEFPGATTKVTFGSEDLKYLKESIIHLWNNGMPIVPANVVFEDVWKKGDDKIFETQLKELADYIIENKLWNKVNCTLFEDTIGVPNDDFMINSNYCGTGRMLAIDAQGNYFPCLRFSDFTLCEKKGIPIGNVETGLDKERIRPFLALSTKAISNQECLNCEVASGCGWCQGCNYDCADSDTIYTRATYICKMHKARVRANNYYWSRLRRETGIVKRTYSANRKSLFFIMSDDAIECCTYFSSKSSQNIMEKKVAEKGLKFCEENFFTPIILNSKTQKNIYNMDDLAMLSRTEIVKNGIKLPYKNYDEFVVLEPWDVDEYEGSKIVLLNVYEESLIELSELISALLPKSQRINIIFKFEFDKSHLDKYEQQIKVLITIMLEYLKNGEFKELNILTDRLFFNEMNNCNAGVDSYALAPNGKIYLCPAFYFETPDMFIGDIYSESEKINANKTLEYSNSPVCNRCDAFQCNRCIKHNQAKTGAYNIPGTNQCIKSHIERNASMYMQQLLKENHIKYGADRELQPLDYMEPMEKIVEELLVNPYSKRDC